MKARRGAMRRSQFQNVITVGQFMALHKGLSYAYCGQSI